MRKKAILYYKGKEKTFIISMNMVEPKVYLKKNEIDLSTASL